MGNCWTGANPVLLLETEKQMLCLSGLPFDDFEVSNVVIDS